MIVGGGLEEPGWRGVAQPELERRWSRWRAATVVGVIWALWHLPLFHIPGVGQYGDSFPLFAASTLGQAGGGPGPAQRGPESAGAIRRSSSSSALTVGVAAIRSARSR